MSRRLLVVSPHLDDAVMSVGATVAAAVELGCHVEICTVFAGQPQPPLSGVAARFHAECGLGDDAITRRRSEDIAAVGVLGGHPVHQDLLDAVYRTSHGGWLCTHDRAMFDPLPLDRQLVAAVAEVVAGRIAETGPDQVWTCHAVGGHVDHRTTRAAVGRATAAYPGAVVRLWDDLPYAWDEPASADDPPEPSRHLTRHLTRHLARHIEAKVTAIECYTSQLEMLWPEQNWRAAMRSRPERLTEPRCHA